MSSWVQEKIAQVKATEERQQKAREWARSQNT
jgi:hypothetical protein